LEIRSAISASAVRFQEKIAAIDKKLREILPEEITGKIKVGHIFDRAIGKIDRDFKKTTQSITVPPILTDERRRRMVDEYQLDLDRWINDFLVEEIVDLREKIQKSVFTGNRYESAIKTIQKSYSVSANKAKFLARQETNLAITKFKEVRYQEVGIEEYFWRCVVGSPAHPVRPMHKALGDRSRSGETFKWNDPPITNLAGQRNIPGQDFNCRCVAVPVVKFKKEKK
jgi:SPP1 gp7 family putative phage head morphogenesis protein